MQQACGDVAETARAAGTNGPESIKINSNLAVRRCIGGWRFDCETSKERIGYGAKGCNFGAACFSNGLSS